MGNLNLIGLRSFIQRLSKSRFVGNVLTVGGGIAAGHAIALVFSPLLTRIYGPAAFGVAAAFTTVLSILTPLATLGYANAIVMAVREEEARALARLSILCALIMCPVSLFIVHFGKPWLVRWAGLEGMPWVIYLVPLSLIISAFLSVANQAAIRNSLYKAKARAYVGSTLLTNIAKLAGGLLVPSGVLLILFALAGSALNFLMQILGSPRQDILKIRYWFGFDGVKGVAWTQRDFALYRMPQSIIRAASIGLPVMLLTSMFGAGPTGQYAITVLMLGAPVMLLGDAVGEVFYQKITRAIADKSDAVYSLINKATLVLIVLGGIVFGIVVAYGDWIFPYFFGAQWSRAGQYSQWIALWMIAMLASRPAVSAMPALRLQGALLTYEVIVTAGRGIALYVGSKVGDDLFSIAAFSIVNVVGYVLLMIAVFSRLKVSGKGFEHA